MSYQLTANPDTVIRLDDGATVPRGHRFWLSTKTGLPQVAVLNRSWFLIPPRLKEPGVTLKSRASNG